MRLYDSHCHLDFEAFAADRPEALERARAAGVVRLLIPGYAPGGWEAAARLATANPGLATAVGIHPLAIAALGDDGVEAGLSGLADAAVRLGAAAIGECGLDARIVGPEGVSLERQVAVLARQVEVARELGRPLVLHVVRCHGHALECLEAGGPLPAGGVVHAYSGSPELVPRYLALGLSLGFGGAITRPRARRAREACERVPLERLLLETDAPDQPPAGHEGERNEPVLLAAILSEAARLRGERPERLAEATYRNAVALFGR